MDYRTPLLLEEGIDSLVTALIILDNTEKTRIEKNGMRLVLSGMPYTNSRDNLRTVLTNLDTTTVQYLEIEEELPYSYDFAMCHIAAAINGDSMSIIRLIQALEEMDNRIKGLLQKHSELRYACGKYISKTLNHLKDKLAERRDFIREELETVVDYLNHVGYTESLADKIDIKIVNDEEIVDTDN